jgi:hypothetical protein
LEPIKTGFVRDDGVIFYLTTGGVWTSHIEEQKFEEYAFMSGKDSPVSSDIEHEIDTTNFEDFDHTTLKVCSGYQYTTLYTDYYWYSWGYNSYGELGIYTEGDALIPEPIDDSGVLKGRTFVSFFCGLNHAAALLDNGLISTWGSNLYGQLGDGTFKDRYVPVIATAVPKTRKSHAVFKLQSRGNSMSVMMVNGDIYSWGQNQGLYGDGTSSDSSAPVLASNQLLKTKGYSSFGNFYYSSSTTICTAPVNCPSGIIPDCQNKETCALKYSQFVEEKNGQSFCSLCLLGYYFDTDEGKCIDCGQGYYLDTIPNPDNNECFECPAGTYSNIFGASSLKDCIKCPKGTYSDIVAKNDTSCINCPIGTYNAFIGADSRSKCLPCPTSSYSAVEGSETILNCQKCPPGTYSTVNGSSSFSDCLPCTQGTYSSLFGSKVCTNCPAGKYGPFSASTTAFNCFK